MCFIFDTIKLKYFRLGDAHTYCDSKYDSNEVNESTNFLSFFGICHQQSVCRMDEIQDKIVSADLKTVAIGFCIELEKVSCLPIETVLHKSEHYNVDCHI